MTFGCTTDLSPPHPARRVSHGPSSSRSRTSPQLSSPSLPNLPREPLQMSLWIRLTWKQCRSTPLTQMTLLETTGRFSLSTAARSTWPRVWSWMAPQLSSLPPPLLPSLSSPSEREDWALACIDSFLSCVTLFCSCTHKCQMHYIFTRSAGQKHKIFS